MSAPYLPQVLGGGCFHEAKCRFNNIILHPLGRSDQTNIRIVHTFDLNMFIFVAKLHILTWRPKETDSLLETVPPLTSRWQHVPVKSKRRHLWLLGGGVLNPNRRGKVEEQNESGGLQTDSELHMKVLLEVWGTFSAEKL